MFSLNRRNNINIRMWYKNTKPYLPSHVINCFRIKIRLFHRGFRRIIGIPLGKQVDLRETMNMLHGTPFSLAFLNHFSPSCGSPVAQAIVFCDLQLPMKSFGVTLSAQSALCQLLWFFEIALFIILIKFLFVNSARPFP
jgi:hypothetical protein